MTYEEKLKAAYQKCREIDKERSALSEKLRKDVAAYKDKRRKEMDDEFEAAYDKQIAADKEYEQIKLARPPHEWVGKYVYIRTGKRSMFHHTTTYTTRCGIVEQRVKGTKFPANEKYRLPELGESFVRLLKADGSIGIAFEKLGKDHAWKLDECQEPAIPKRAIAVAKRIVAREKSGD